MKSHRKYDLYCFFILYQHFVLFHNVKVVLFQKFENANLTQRHIVTNVLFRTIFLFREKNINNIILFSREQIIFAFSLFFALMIISGVSALAVTCSQFEKRKKDFLAILLDILGISFILYRHYVTGINYQLIIVP